MLSEKPPEPGISQPDSLDSNDSEIEPISPEEAEVILKAAMEPHIADGWHVLDENAYYARLTRGMFNLDIQVDLLGNVEEKQMGLTPLQESGQLMAWAVLIAMLMVMLALSSALGIL